MKKTTTVIIVVVAIIALIVLSMVGVYNSMVTKEETVSTAWANVETQYQRRADLIPNLVNTVRGYATHERETFEQVTEARSRATQVRIDPNNITPEALAEYTRAQNEVGSALSRLLMVQENYPDLKANQNFLELQAQLEGTENRINQARRDYNEAARDFNVTIRRFPRNILASMFGFSQKPYFAAQEGTETAPTVNF